MGHQRRNVRPKYAVSWSSVRRGQQLVLELHHQPLHTSDVSGHGVRRVLLLRIPHDPIHYLCLVPCRKCPPSENFKDGFADADCSVQPETKALPLEAMDRLFEIKPVHSANKILLKELREQDEQFRHDADGAGLTTAKTHLSEKQGHVEKVV